MIVSSCILNILPNDLLHYKPVLSIMCASVYILINTQKRQANKGYLHFKVITT